MAFRKKWRSIINLKPDIIVVQECENESKYLESQIIPNYNEFIWIGENVNKGIGIISFNGFHIRRSSKYSQEFKYVVPIEVSGIAEFELYATWAMPHKVSKVIGYVGQIWNAVNHYKLDLASRSIFIGDWNSNVKWDHERKRGNHSHVVNLLRELGILSVYHELNRIEQGRELQPTLFLLKNRDKPYHIDYCFASQSMITKETSVKIGGYDEWIKLSDHMPIVIDNLKLENT